MGVTLVEKNAGMNAERFSVVGYNEDADNALEVVTPGGVWLRPAAAAVVKLSSGSAADAAAGTGARTVGVYGLNAAGALISETVTLNGQALVTTTALFLRILAMKVLTTGTGGTNAGIIYCQTGTVTAGVPDDLTLVQGHIPLGLGTTMAAAWTMPAGKSWKIDGIVVQGTVATITYQVTLNMQTIGSGPRAYVLPVALPPGSAAYPTAILPLPITVPPLTDVWLTTLASAANGAVSAGISGKIIG